MDTDLGRRLVTAGVELLDEGGIGAVGIREVARRCGVSHGAPRRHFSSRAALLAEVARRCLADLRARLDVPDADLGTVARAYVAFAVERPEAFDLMVRHDLLADSGQALRETSLPLVDRWVEIHRQACPGGDELDALTLWAAVHGIASLASRRTLDLVGVDAEALIRRALPRTG